jgi:2-amino-4-hydroxy-6-hydroxymethyldihydropteridine diphosphokinase
MVDVYVGLGTNVQPRQHVVDGLARLRERFGELRCSSVYRSPPYGFQGDDFLNVVVTFPTAQSPAYVEEVLTAVEDAAGRPSHGQRRGPRTLDLDLLLYGERVDAQQRLPREDVLRYPFVLAPLCELQPDLRHPVTGVPLTVAWQAILACNPTIRRCGSVAALG